MLALGAIAFSVRRDLKAERAGTRKKGTWRAHLKLHLAALALVSLCAWLVGWRGVYDKEAKRPREKPTAVPRSPRRTAARARKAR